MLDRSSQTVAVTGIAGYVASVLAYQLVELGYGEVRGSVRSLGDEAKVAHLREVLPTVKLYEADLLAEGSF